MLDSIKATNLSARRKKSDTEDKDADATIFYKI